MLRQPFLEESSVAFYIAPPFVLNEAALDWKTIFLQSVQAIYKFLVVSRFFTNYGIIISNISGV